MKLQICKTPKPNKWYILYFECHESKLVVPGYWDTNEGWLKADGAKFLSNWICRGWVEAPEYDDIVTS